MYSSRAVATLEEKKRRALKGGGEKRIEKQHKTVCPRASSSMYPIPFLFLVTHHLVECVTVR